MAPDPFCHLAIRKYPRLDPTRIPDGTTYLFPIRPSTEVSDPAATKASWLSPAPLARMHAHMPARACGDRGADALCWDATRAGRHIPHGSGVRSGCPAALGETASGVRKALLSRAPDRMSEGKWLGVLDCPEEEIELKARTRVHLSEMRIFVFLYDILQRARASETCIPRTAFVFSWAFRAESFPSSSSQDRILDAGMLSNLRPLRRADLSVWPAQIKALWKLIPAHAVESPRR